MARTKGTYNLSANIETNAAAPLDARSKVPVLADLTASGTFDYPYVGMHVYVVSEEKWYTLKGDDPTDSSNWSEDSSGGGGTSRDYSETEQEGGKWTDGVTPWYYKTIPFSGLPNNTTKIIAHGISNLGVIIGIEGGAYSTNSEYLPLPNNNVLIKFSPAFLYLTTSSNLSSYSIGYITIKYLKSDSEVLTLKHACKTNDWADHRKTSTRQQYTMDINTDVIQYYSSFLGSDYIFDYVGAASSSDHDYGPYPITYDVATDKLICQAYNKEIALPLKPFQYPITEVAFDLSFTQGSGNYKYVNVALAKVSGSSLVILKGQNFSSAGHCSLTGFSSFSTSDTLYLVVTNAEAKCELSNIVFTAFD